MENLKKNIAEICKDKGIKQSVLAEKLGITQSALSIKLNNAENMKVSSLYNIAKVLQVNIIDLFTYPDKYIKDTATGVVDEPKVLLTIELTQKKKDQAMKLVFGDNELKLR